MRLRQLLIEGQWLTYISVIAKQTGTSAREWERADGPQIGPGEDQWYVHKTNNQIVQVSVFKGKNNKAIFVHTTEDGEPLGEWELT